MDRIFLRAPTQQYLFTPDDTTYRNFRKDLFEATLHHRQRPNKKHVYSQEFRPWKGIAATDVTQEYTAYTFRISNRKTVKTAT